jgi:hypothetical protein
VFRLQSNYSTHTRWFLELAVQAMLSDEEHENVEWTHYLSYMLVYFVLQVACIITVGIRENNQ